MHSYEELLSQFESFFDQHQFPAQPKELYEPCTYLLHIGGKRIRPLLCLMCHELFAPLNSDVWNTATAIELFHNFTLMHDDIMDKSPLRRGFATVHEKYGMETAILSGDVLNIFSYVHLNKINAQQIHSAIDLFNKTAIEICEGQQLDMNFEKMESISTIDYMHMIKLKTSVLLGASAKLGAMLGGATDGCSQVLYQFGIQLGLAFQIKDDYLDTYGDTTYTGKKIGGDIMCNKKTLLMARAYELADATEKKTLQELALRNDDNKIYETIALFNKLGIPAYIENEIAHHTKLAFDLLEKTPVISKRKIHLHQLATFLLHRKK